MIQSGFKDQLDPPKRSKVKLVAATIRKLTIRRGDCLVLSFPEWYTEDRIRNVWDAVHRMIRLLGFAENDVRVIPKYDEVGMEIVRKVRERGST